MAELIRAMSSFSLEIRTSLLGWVNIDISQIRINLNINNRNREASYHEFRTITIKNSTVKQEVFNSNVR